jgi:hypothetical protein
MTQKDLLKGCELVATGALVIHQDKVGCSRSVRHYVKQAPRGVVATCLQLVQVFSSGYLENDTVGTEKTISDGNKLFLKRRL